MEILRVKGEGLKGEGAPTKGASRGARHLSGRAFLDDLPVYRKTVRLSFNGAKKTKKQIETQIYTQTNTHTYTSPTTIYAKS